MPADISFYVSLAGFVISLILWFYLFRKYRESDKSLDEALPAMGTSRSSRPAASPVPLEPEAISALTAGSGPTLATFKSGQTAAGNINPAAVYLQNLKEQLDAIHKELLEFRAAMSGINQRNDALFNDILRRLAEIKRTTAPTAGSSPPAASQPPPVPSAGAKKDPVWPI